MTDYIYDYKKLFKAFIRDSLNGKRRLANGNRISKDSVNNYISTLNKIMEYEKSAEKSLRLRHIGKLGRREQKSEQKYWAKFGADFLQYLSKQGLLDNYIGFHFKNLKTFHRYLKLYRNIDTGPMSAALVVKKEEPPVVVLSTERFKYLASNLEFRNSLPANLLITMDIFIFGCCTGLRYSDLSILRRTNLEKVDGAVYLVVRSKKTHTDTRIKLPIMALERMLLYRYRQVTLFPKLSLAQFNSNLKQLFEKAGWTEECPKLRSRNGQVKAIKQANGKNFRFCDMASSHMMRKTAITTMLMLGMPEPLVRKISGHAANSKEFYRYVKYSQSFVDEYTDAVFEKLSN